MKPSDSEIPAEWFVDMLEWTTCPHCKKIIFRGDTKTVGALKKWRDQWAKISSKVSKKRK